MLLYADIYVIRHLIADKQDDARGDFDVARYKNVDEVRLLEFYAEQIFK